MKYRIGDKVILTSSAFHPYIPCGSVGVVVDVFSVRSRPLRVDFGGLCKRLSVFDTDVVPYKDGLERAVDKINI